MKKKTKSKLNIKIFSRFELLFFTFSEILCLGFIAAGGYAFYKSMNRMVVKADEKPVAIVSGKIKTSRRCFERHNVWDILKKNSLIYNGDLICTEANSQATLVFNDGVELTLAESTMTQIVVGEDNQLKISLTGGNVLVDSTSKSRPATIIYNNSKISIQGKALVSAAEVEKQDKKSSDNKKKKLLEVQVIDGKAKVASEKTEAVEVQVGQMVHIDEVEKSETAVTMPVEIKTSREASAVTVMVEKQNKLESKSKSQDKKNNTKVISQAVSASQVKAPREKRPENFYKVQKKIDEVSKIEVSKPSVQNIPAIQKPKKQNLKLSVSAPQLLKPAMGKIFDDSYFVENQKIIFSWTAVEDATNYRFIMEDSNGKILLDKMLGKENSFVLKDLAILSDGSNTTWQIQAIVKQDERIVASSAIKKSWFTVRLGEISGKASLSGNLYGR